MSNPEEQIQLPEREVRVGKLIKILIPKRGETQSLTLPLVGNVRKVANTLPDTLPVASLRLWSKTRPKEQLDRTPPTPDVWLELLDSLEKPQKSNITSALYDASFFYTSYLRRVDKKQIPVSQVQVGDLRSMVDILFDRRALYPVISERNAFIALAFDTESLI